MGVYTKEQLGQLVIDYAYGLGFPPSIALEQIKRESANFRDDVVYGPFVGGAGERGMSQFTPGTWERFGEGPHTNAYDPDYAMSAWFAYMQFLLNRYDWNIEKALQGYNGGEGNVDRGTVSSGARRYASEILEKANYGMGDYVAVGTPQPSADNLSENKLLTYVLIGVAVLGALLLLKD